MKGLFCNLSFLILLGILLGISCGIFFGEYCAFLTPVGEAYTMLLRMSVLPYIACALIHGIGRLSTEEIKRLIRKGWPYFILIWSITLLIIYSMKALLPSSFTPGPIHPDLLQIDQTPFDFLELFIPTNPFKALANDIVPSIVVFCLIFGASLVKLPNKNALLNPLDTIISSLNQVTTWVSYLGPIGSFALMASGTGTLHLVDIDKIQLYLLGVLIGSLFLALWLFPLMITSFTDLKYRDLCRELPTMFLLSFTAANPLIAFPYLLKAVKNLSTKCDIPEQDAQKTCEAVVPIALNFPTAGNFFALLFIVFLAFYYGLELKFDDYLKLNSIGFIALFGPTSQIGSAISFLMDILQIPADGHSLYLNSFLITRYFVALVSVSGVTTLTVLIVFSYGHKIFLKFKKIFSHTVLSLLILAMGLSLGRYLELTPKNITPSFARLTLEPIVPVSVNLTLVKPHDFSKLSPSIKEDSLDIIRNTKILRVGYAPHTMPFSYFNHENDLVGFDIAMAYQLAYALDAQLELIPFKWRDLKENLQHDLFDIAMSGILINEETLDDVFASNAYLQGSFALVVRDFQRSVYNSYARVKSRKGLKIAVLNCAPLQKVSQTLFPNAEIIPIEHIQEFLKPNAADALFWTEESAQPWTCFNPQFTVVNPSPGLAKSNYAYLMASHSPKLKKYVDDWMTQHSALIETQHRYWLTHETDRAESRWCIIRDVLHWVK